MSLSLARGGMRALVRPNNHEAKRVLDLRRRYEPKSIKLARSDPDLRAALSEPRFMTRGIGPGRRPRRSSAQTKSREARTAMYYSDHALQQLFNEYAALNGKLNDLLEKFFFLEVKDSRAIEFARQGLPRRLKVMVRCITNVFDQIPPDRTDLPSRDELSDATINIQSFVFNVFGAIDNLAWLWMRENGQKRLDGTPIPDTFIGLGPKNESVRATLSKELQDYIKTLDAWFEHLAHLRHALAHRIPLYIPPYVIESKDEAAYKDFEKKMAEAAKKHDFAEYDRLSAEQLKLGRFRPWVQHSFEEKATPVVFHAQMLSDFNTVDELSRKMLHELSRPRT
jgi:hypothetical protein